MYRFAVDGDPTRGEVLSDPVLAQARCGEAIAQGLAGGGVGVCHVVILCPAVFQGGRNIRTRWVSQFSVVMS